MARLQQSRDRNCSLVNVTNNFNRLTSGAAILTVWLAFALLLATAIPMQAQALGNIYSFTGGSDGGNVLAGVVADAAGNLYGTTAGSIRQCSIFGPCGTVFELSPNGSQWVFKTLYRFHGGDDGAYPASRLAIGPDGSLYGTTVSGGGINQLCQYQYGCGTVFKLTHNSDGSWTESIIYRFQIQEDLNAGYGNGVVVDQGGNLYGTDARGGAFGAGSVYQLTPSDGGYVYSVIHTFGAYPDGTDPASSPTLDSAGDLYGTLLYGLGPCGCSLVWKLTRSADGWIYNIIYQPTSYDGGGLAYAGVVLDSAGNVYGAYATGGASVGLNDYGSGTIFELTPSSDGWDYSLLHHWSVDGGRGPTDLLAIDAAGNVYGTDFEEVMTGGVTTPPSLSSLRTPMEAGASTDLYFPYPGDGTSGPTLAPNGRLYGPHPKRRRLLLGQRI